MWTLPYVRVALVYLVLGVLWIAGSDWLVAAIAPNKAVLNYLQTIKGWLFVIASTLLLYFLMRRAFRDLKRSEMAKREIFRSTVRASDHIVLNYINQMQLVTLEADRVEGFDSSVRDLAHRITRETVEEIQRLEALEAKGADEIELFLKQRLIETRAAIQRAAKPLDN
ncbi:hypothetical protein QEH54_20055 [Pelagicoccus sp. SDUM812003]|nr:hypothetical protein [Pelagicoccus sp. SDUM812003]